MAQPHHLTGNPVKLSPPSVSPSKIEAQSRLHNFKRPREDESSGGASTDAPELKRHCKVAQDVVYRIIVPSRQIGKVIGRVGHRIQKIREEFRATIKIADAIARHEERVIIISSKDSESELCDAELALHHIVSMILKDDDADVETRKQATGHMTANTIRLLIAGSQAGSLIGLNGQNIEILRNDCGSTIAVLAQNQLPPCASALESDRVVQVSGDVGSVQKAVMKIGFQLRNNPSEQAIPTKPSYNYGFSTQPHQQVDPTSAEYVNLEIMVPEAMVGGLIGRCGSNISRIRAESGATVKVHGGKGEQTQRQIHLGGSAQQVALARQRIDEYVYSRMMSQSGEQPQMPAVSRTMFQANRYHQTNLFQGLDMNSSHGTSVIPVHFGVYATVANPTAAYHGQLFRAPPL